MAQVQRNGAFSWNAGGWFGSQIGATAYVTLIGLIVLFDEPRTGLWLFLCGAIPNMIGYALWRRRDRLRPYPAIQLLLMTVFVFTAVFMTLIFTIISEPLYEKYFHGIRFYHLAILGIFPAMMASFHRLEMLNRKAHQPIGIECESCTMVMTIDKHHGGGDPKNPRCVNCCHPDGTFKSREEVFEGTVNWLLSDQCAQDGFPQAQSIDEAKERAEKILQLKELWQ